MNVIYFNPDEMRADLLGCYGHPLAKTPHFDKLAAEGVRFDNCYVQHTVCTPSRCSFMTGWYPHTRGHRTLWHTLGQDEPNTMKYLKQAGYDVHMIGKNDLFAPEALDDSITRLHAVKVPEPPEEQADKPVDYFGRPVPPDDPRFMDFLYVPRTEHNHDWYSMDEAINFLKSRKPDDPPFMLFLAFGYPHCPYTCPEPWYSMYDPDDLPPLRPKELPGKPDFYHLIRKYRRLDEIDDAELRKIMAVYLGMISYVDHNFGRMMKALEETGLIDDTAVFFFSDHGDWAGDYGLVEKWPSGLDDCLTRIPMIVKTPDCKAGHVVEEPIECFDIVPTTLELANVECKHTHAAVSMMPQLAGKAGDPERAAYAEGGYDRHEPQCFEGSPSDGICSNPTGIYHPKGLQQQEEPQSVCRSTMLRTMTHKLVRRPDGVDELYDLEKDPLELENVFDCEEYRDIKHELQARMLDWYVKTADAVPFERRIRGFPAEFYS